MLRKFKFRGMDVAADIVSKYGFDGDLLALFAETSDAEVHKWHHYIPIYDRYFSRFRRQPVRFLEIGVSRGGSLRVWRNYFGPDAVIFGIDIDPDCARHDGDYGAVRIGSQSDGEFLHAVVREMGGIDIVLDDGSHVMSDIRRSLEVIFPLLSEGGVYLVEDLHTAYSEKYGGGVRAAANFFNLMREITDDMHGWYHSQGVAHPFADRSVTGLHVHDSIAVLEKGRVHAPVHSRIGLNGQANHVVPAQPRTATQPTANGEVAIVEEASLVFTTEPGSSRTYGAVFDRDLEPVDLSHDLDAGKIQTLRDLCRSNAPTPKRMAGTYAYGGDVSGHFGHQIVENTGRAWVQDHVDGAIDGTLFFPRRMNLSQVARMRARQTLSTIGVAAPICLDEPVQIDRLVVARPGWGIGPLMTGTAEMRRFLRTRHAASDHAASGRKLYLTRRRQPLRRGHILMEERFEDLFREEGFEVVEPEALDLAAQLELYRNAACIVAVEASLFHVVAMSASADCIVAVLKRRNTRVFDDICNNLDAFLGKSVLRIGDTVSRWIALSGRTQVEFPEISAGRLWDTLVASGISIRAPRWAELSPGDLERSLDRIRQGLPALKPLEQLAG